MALYVLSPYEYIHNNVSIPVEYLSLFELVVNKSKVWFDAS